jgi:hypothetical protein
VRFMLLCGQSLTYPLVRISSENGFRN